MIHFFDFVEDAAAFRHLGCKDFFHGLQSFSEDKVRLNVRSLFRFIFQYATDLNGTKSLHVSITANVGFGTSTEAQRGGPLSQWGLDSRSLRLVRWRATAKSKSIMAYGTNCCSLFLPMAVIAVHARLAIFISGCSLVCLACRRHQLDSLAGVCTGS